MFGDKSAGTDAGLRALLHCSGARKESWSKMHSPTRSLVEKSAGLTILGPRRFRTDTIFVNQSASASLAYIDGNGNAILKVDNTSVVPYNEKRNTVRIQTTETVSVSSRSAGGYR